MNHAEQTALRFFLKMQKAAENGIQILMQIVTFIVKYLLPGPRHHRSQHLFRPWPAICSLVLAHAPSQKTRVPFPESHTKDGSAWVAPGMTFAAVLQSGNMSWHCHTIFTCLLRFSLLHAPLGRASLSNMHAAASPPNSGCSRFRIVPIGRPTTGPTYSYSAHRTPHTVLGCQPPTIATFTTPCLHRHSVYYNMITT